MANGIEIQRLAPSDAAELARTLKALDAAGDREPKGRSAAHLAHLTRSLAAPSCYVLLASEAGAPVGYVSAYRFPRLDHASDQVYVFDMRWLRRHSAAGSAGSSSRRSLRPAGRRG